MTKTILSFCEQNILKSKIGRYSNMMKNILTEISFISKFNIKKIINKMTRLKIAVE